MPLQTNTIKIGLGKQRGMALVLVIVVLATAAVLAYAMLATNTLQAQTSSNLLQAANAEYAAESGVNVAMYYLQWPALAPASWTNTPDYTLFATGVPLNDGTPVNFNVSATPNAQLNTYTIQSTGYPSAGSAFSHLATATVTVNRVQIPGAGVFGGSITIPSHSNFSNSGVTGAVAVQAAGSVSQIGGTITGAISQAPLAAIAYVVPDTSSVNFYGVGVSGGNYLWSDGVTLGTPQQIAANNLTSAKVPARLASNPAGIFYHQGNLSITGNVVLNGALIVRGGTLTVEGSLTINPVAQFPALVCEENVIIEGAGNSLTANGVAYLGTGFSWAGATAGSALVVNGALMMPSGASIVASASGTISVTYNAATANVPQLSTFSQPALSVQTNSWTQ